MAHISLQEKIVYGPVFSRRLGRSFGINLLPLQQKMCSFNCVYCQYGPTERNAFSCKENNLPGVGDVLEAVEKALRKPRSMDVLTFAGNGEPTLHPNFLEIVQGTKIIRDRLRPEVKLVLLSNSSRVTDPDIQEAINIIDLPMMKLDAGDQRTFQAINRPEYPIDLSVIMKTLKELRGLIIQSMLIDGPVANISGEAFQSWLDAILDIDPKEIHIYSTERPTAEESVVKVDPGKLKQIEDVLNDHYGLTVRAFC